MKMEVKKRTCKDFVKQMFKEGKTPYHIRAVASCSAWANKMDEVEMWITRGKKIMSGKKKKRIKIRPA